VNGPSAAEVRAFLVERLGDRLRAAGLDLESLPEDTDLLAAGIVDSLGVLELMTTVSDRFGLDDDWEDYDPDDILVLGPFCRYVELRATDGSLPA
jgi:acyl carrier protein